MKFFYWCIEILQLFNLILSSGLCLGQDIPCNKVRTDNGYVCSCNAEHCDTINQPEIIPKGTFHVYFTSDRNPGFNHYTGDFEVHSYHPHGHVLEVNASKTFQNITGFGGSFTDSFGYVLSGLSLNTSEKLMRSYFSEEGLQYSLCRVVFGCSDFSLRYYTYVPDYDPTLQSFNFTEDDYLYKIPPIKKALNISKEKINFLGCSWFPPEWMKIDGSFPSRYISPKFHNVWADYHIKILDALKLEGIEMWGISTPNEPAFLYAMRYPLGNSLMLPEEQRDFIVQSLGPAIKKSNYTNIKLIVMEDQRQYAYWWMDTIMRHKEAKNFVSGIGVHWYYDTIYSPDIMNKIHDKFPNQEILYTEATFDPSIMLNHHEYEGAKQEPPPPLGFWRRAELLASDIIENLNHWVTSFIDWNLALDLTGGPNFKNFSCDAAIIVNKTNDEFYKEPFYYAMGHFSKFMRPGSVVIDIKTNNASDTSNKSADESSIPKFGPTTYLDPRLQFIGTLNEDGRYSIVLLNPQPVPQEVAIHDPERGYAFLILRPHSINTLIYW